MAPVLEMALQPIVDLHSGRVVGVESLARFADHRPPDLHFAEATTPRRRLALELAAVRAGLARIRELPLDAYLTVNVSPDTAATRELASILADAPASRIVLELTEHSPVGDYEALGSALAGLRARGLRVAVDDACAGFASMRHVLALRPDVIKLDVSITRGIDADPQRRELVRALVQFSRATGCTLVAEGIETVEELAEVRRLGVGCGQGFWLGRPDRSAAGPWQLLLPPLRRSKEALDSGGRLGRFARPAAVLLAAAIAPGLFAVAGLKMPSDGAPIQKAPAVEVRTDRGGSALVPAKASRPAAAQLLAPATPAVVRTAARVPVPGTPTPSPDPSLVGGTVQTVDSVVTGVVQTAGKTVDSLTKTVGILLGGKRGS